MKKIPSVFKRNYEVDRLCRDEVVEGCEWVLAGEGVATIKWDGTACLIQDGRLYKRYDAKQGRTPPDGFLPCEEAPDPVTGHWPGWLPVGDGPEDQWHREAWKSTEGMPDGTYELIGPKVQGNPCGETRHFLLRHDSSIWRDCPRSYEGLRDLLACICQEGIVFHHPDGRMAKVKRRDFGLRWPITKEDKMSPNGV